MSARARQPRRDQMKVAHLELLRSHSTLVTRVHVPEKCVQVQTMFMEHNGCLLQDCTLPACSLLHRVRPTGRQIAASGRARGGRTHPNTLRIRAGCIETRERIAQCRNPLCLVNRRLGPKHPYTCRCDKLKRMHVPASHNIATVTCDWEWVLHHRNNIRKRNGTTHCLCATVGVVLRGTTTITSTSTTIGEMGTLWSNANDCFARQV